MALDVAAITRSIRNVLDGTFTGIRDVASGTYQDAQAVENKGLALVTPTFDIDVAGIATHSAAPFSVSSSRSIEVLDLSIVITTTLPSGVLIDERYTAQAAQVNNANLAIQALTFPGNLDDDAASPTPNPTGIVSGMLTGPGGTGNPVASFARDWSTQIATTTIQASAVVVVAQPVS